MFDGWMVTFGVKIKKSWNTWVIAKNQIENTHKKYCDSWKLWISIQKYTTLGRDDVGSKKVCEHVKVCSEL